MSMRLFNRPRSATPGLRIVRNDATPTMAEVFVYDEIGPWYGVIAKDFVAEIRALDVAELHVRVNSPGGDVFDAMAIANALRDHPAHVVSHVDALAASAASFIAMAADEVRMADNAFLMIHNAWTFAMGDAAAFRKTADTLDTINGAIVGEYVKKTGATAAEITALMDAETWLNATDALDWGFIDAIDGAGESSAKNAYDLRVFANTPAELLTPGATPAGGKRDIERALRDAGCSRSEAKAIAALAGPVLAPRDAAEDTAMHDLTQSLQRTLQLLS